MKKRFGELEEFEFEPLTSEPDMHVTIAVSGWVTNRKPGKYKFMNNEIQVFYIAILILSRELKFLLQSGGGYS